MLRLLTRSHEPDKASIVRAARDIYFIPEGTPLSVQLVKFQHNKERIGLVVDEYGDIQGMGYTRGLARRDRRRLYHFDYRTDAKSIFIVKRMVPTLLKAP